MPHNRRRRGRNKFAILVATGDPSDKTRPNADGNRPAFSRRAISPSDEMISRVREMISARDEMTSPRREMISARDGMTSPRGEMT